MLKLVHHHNTKTKMETVKIVMWGRLPVMDQIHIYLVLMDFFKHHYQQEFKVLVVVRA